MNEVVAGRFRLDNVIGSGGMGTVWRGYDLVLHRPVAVKEIHLPPQLGAQARAEAIARAFTEGRNAARLNHPGIVSVHDIAEHDGRPWIIMQLVDGVSLLQHVRNHGPLPVAEVARIGLAVLGALNAAHAAGVIHRDVKPSNVLVGPDGGILLTDFSIASAIGAATMTNTGILLGSPGYIAPERVAGRRAGPPADLFGLGATLFFLVESYGPFDNNDDALASLLASASRPHPRPVNAGPLTAVIDGLLAKDPDVRMTAGATADALASIAGHTRGVRFPRPPVGPRPAVGRPPGTAPVPVPMHVGGPSTTRQTWRRAPVLAVGALVGVLVASGVFLALRPRPDANAALQPASTGSATPSPTVSATPSAPTPTPSAETPTATASASSGGGQPPRVDNPPVIQSVIVSPSTVCVGRFTITMVAYDDSGHMTAGYQFTMYPPDGSGGIPWGGPLTPGPNNTWTAEVGRPEDNGLFTWVGSTIEGIVSAYDGVNIPPVTRPFPTVTVVSC